MVTLPVAGRLAFAQRSIQAYCSQTHPLRDLVIMMDEGEADVRAELARYVESLGRDDIRLLGGVGGRTLGELRNLSVEAAEGDVICQWDDDDLFHPRRIESQLTLLVGGAFEAVYLQEVMQYYPGLQQMFLTNWRGTEARGHPGTLMARLPFAARYPVRGEESARGEDLSVALQLATRGKVGFVEQQPWLFVYVSHGSNTWDLNHHLMLSNELSVSQGLLRRREDALRDGLAPFGFAPDSIEVCGSNGAAFQL